MREDYIIARCPFCRAEASPNYHEHYTWVECHGCLARGPKVDCPAFYHERDAAYDNAVDLWNKRVAPFIPKGATHVDNQGNFYIVPPAGHEDGTWSVFANGTWYTTEGSDAAAAGLKPIKYVLAASKTVYIPAEATHVDGHGNLYIAPVVADDKWTWLILIDRIWCPTWLTAEAIAQLKTIQPKAIICEACVAEREAQQHPNACCSKCWWQIEMDPKENHDV